MSDEELQPSTSDEGADEGAPDDDANQGGTDGQSTDSAPSTQPTGRTYTDEEVRRLQSAKDREIAELRRSNQQVEQLRHQVQQLELASIPEDQRAARAQQMLLENQRSQLLTAQDQLNLLAKTQMVTQFTNEYARFGVKAEDLEGFDNPAEMRAYVFEKKAEYLEREVKNPRKTPAIAKKSVDSGQGAGGGSSTDLSKFRGTGRIVDALREKSKAGR